MPIQLSVKRLIEKIVKEQTPTSTAEPTVMVQTYADLGLLTNKKEGVLYLVADEDIIYVYDAFTNTFISRVKEMDGGNF